MRIKCRKIRPNAVGEPAATTHPIRGGKAPEMAPISIAIGDFFFRECKWQDKLLK